MSGAGAPDQQPVDCHDLRVAIVAASWHETVMDGLIEGAQRACRDYQVEAPELVRVPGTFELPVVADAVAAQGYDAVVALGVVIRGGTPHFEYVCSAATDGLNRVALDRQTAVGFGVLTCDTEEQALDRAGLTTSHEDKGYEAAAAALTTAQTLRAVRRGYAARLPRCEDLRGALDRAEATRRLPGPPIRAPSPQLDAGCALHGQEAGRGGRRVVDGGRARGAGAGGGGDLPAALPGAGADAGLRT